MPNERIRRTVLTYRLQLSRPMLSKGWFVKVFYRSWIWVLQNLSFERVAIRIHWQAHWKVKNTCRHINTGNARIQKTVVTNRLRAWTFMTNHCSRDIDLWKCSKDPGHTLPGAEFWKVKIRIDCGQHRKNGKTTRAGFAGPSLCGVKLKILKKMRILAGLLDKNEPDRDRPEQQ